MFVGLDEGVPDAVAAGSLTTAVWGLLSVSVVAVAVAVGGLAVSTFVSTFVSTGVVGEDVSPAS